MKTAPSWSAEYHLTVSTEFTPAVLSKIRRRRRALRKSRKVRPGKYNPHLALARRLMREINSKLSDNRRKAVLDCLHRFKDDPKRFWGVVTELWNGKRRSTTINLLDDQGETVPEMDIANYINSYYASIGAKLAEAFVI